MATKKNRLGRGLDALLSPEATEERKEGDRLINLPVEQLQRGRYQPRTGMDKARLEELAESIRAQGVVQPIVARPIGEGRYEIVAGERRWRAAQLAGLHEIPAVVREIPDQAAVAMALIENIQREDLNPLEEAGALRRLIDEFEMTHQQVATAVGRSRASVSNLLRLADLHPDVRALVESRDLEMGHARTLLALTGKFQVEAAREVVRRGLSVRETEALVRRKLEAPKAAKKPARKDPDIARLEQDLTERLAARVTIQHSAKGKGRLVIHYNSADELEGLLERVK